MARPRGPSRKIQYTSTALVISGTRYPAADLDGDTLSRLAIYGIGRILTAPDIDIAATWETLKSGAGAPVEHDPDAYWREAAAIVLAEAATRPQPGKTRRASPGYAENLAAQRKLTAEYTDAQLEIAKRVPEIRREYDALTVPAASLTDLLPAAVEDEAA